MKKFLVLLAALALCVCLCGCEGYVSLLPGSEPVAVENAPAPDGQETDAGDFREQSLLEFMGWRDFAASYYDDTPVALSMRVGDNFDSPIFDRTSIISACDALRAMTVTGRAPGVDTAAQKTVFTFTMADGETYSVTFTGRDVTLTAGTYTVTGGDSLWALAFPGYGGDFDIFDLYNSANMRAFADQFSQNTPLTVGRRQNGGATLTSSDPAIVQQVFALLANAAVERVEQSPDQNIDLTQTTDYVFTMPDASAVTVSFTGPCLAVTASEDYGTVYYWLRGVDDLPYVPVVPESTVPTFAGGPLTDLREDIAQAQQAANGWLNGIAVEGVYVDYAISGYDPGYLTLSGSVATSFVQQVTSITATGDTAEVTSGDTITVFVTLSDQSGPIIVFMGDTVQQVVGVNHPCDANAMANLRATILRLAQDSNNVGAVVGGTD